MGALSADQLPFAPSDSVFSLFACIAQSKQAGGREVWCRANPHAVIGDFFDQTGVRECISLA